MPPATPAAALTARVLPLEVTVTLSTLLRLASPPMAEVTLPWNQVPATDTPTPAQPPTAAVTTVVNAGSKYMSASTVTSLACVTSPSIRVCTSLVTTSAPIATATPATPPPPATTPIMRTAELLTSALPWYCSFASSSTSFESELSVTLLCLGLVASTCAPPVAAAIFTLLPALSFAPSSTPAETLLFSTPTEMPTLTPATPPMDSTPEIIRAESSSLDRMLMSPFSAVTFAPAPTTAEVPLVSSAWPAGLLRLRSSAPWLYSRTPKLSAPVPSALLVWLPG